MSANALRTTFCHYANDADISVIEGNKGLFDGMDVEGSDSNAALASLLHTPIILVIDGEGMTRGIAPLILGYQQFGEGLHIAGVILNNVKGDRHQAKLVQGDFPLHRYPGSGRHATPPRLGNHERHPGLND